MRFQAPSSGALAGGLMSMGGVAMTRSPRSMLAALAGAAVLVAAFAACAEDAILVSSTVQAYVPGSVIADSQTLVLASGASATLLFRSGAVVRMKGPFEGRLDAVRPAASPGAWRGWFRPCAPRASTPPWSARRDGFSTPSARAAAAGAARQRRRAHLGHLLPRTEGHALAAELGRRRGRDQAAARPQPAGGGLARGRRTRRVALRHPGGGR